MFTGTFADFNLNYKLALHGAYLSYKYNFNVQKCTTWYKLVPYGTHLYFFLSNAFFFEETFAFGSSVGNIEQLFGW